MTQKNPLSADDLDMIRNLDMCAVSNAIERFNVRLRNEGFVHGSVHCQFPGLQPMLGHAVPERVRCSNPPMTIRCYYDRMYLRAYIIIFTYTPVLDLTFL